MGEKESSVLPSVCEPLSRAADPGAVKTEILREVPGWLRDFCYYVLGFLRVLSLPEAGSRAILDAALAAEVCSLVY